MVTHATHNPGPSDSFDQRQRLTLDQVRSPAFPPARLGRRGLDEAPVRQFCEQVEAELIRLLNERTSLNEEVSRLRERVRSRRDGASPSYTPEDAHVQAVRILSNAQQTADKYVADAQAYSRDVALDARGRREEMLAEARARAARILEDAHHSATQAAERAPASIEPGMHPDDRRELEAELAYLRTYSDVTRTHLRAYLESLTRSIEEWEKADRSATATGYERVTHP
jgi:cell division septum initiation protein DivIVA